MSSEVPYRKLGGIKRRGPIIRANAMKGTLAASTWTLSASVRYSEGWGVIRATAQPEQASTVFAIASQDVFLIKNTPRSAITIPWSGISQRLDVFIRVNGGTSTNGSTRIGSPTKHR